MTKENQTQSVVASATVSGAMNDDEIYRLWQSHLIGHSLYDEVIAFGRAILSRAQDAQAVRNAALEEAAKQCDALANCEENTDGYRAGASWCAERIRYLQSAPAQPVERPDAVELPRMPPYIYGRECGENERVYSEDQMREYALEAIAANQPQQEKQGWYCANCGKGVPPEEVTYSEHHTLCGGPVGGWPPQRGNAQERWVDTRCVELDRSILMGPSYDWDGWECSRIEMHTPHASFAVWPHQLGGKQRWSMYCNRGGLLIFERFATAEAAKAEAEMVAESIAATVAAPQVAQEEGARDLRAKAANMILQIREHLGFSATAKDAALLIGELADALSAAPQSDAQQSIEKDAFKPRELATLNGQQLQFLADSTQTDGKPDLETEITLIEHAAPFKSTDGEDMPAGLYFYWTEYPEEGIVLIEAISSEGAI